MEPDISHQTFISTVPPKKKKKRKVSSKRILDLLSPIKHIRSLRSTLSPTKKRRRKRKSANTTSNNVNGDQNPVLQSSSTILPNPHFNCTIDLSGDDSLSEPVLCETPNKTVECVEDCVVLCDSNKEKPNQREIIDLTTNSKILDGSENQEPTVIDLSDSDDKQIFDNEIFVVGTYSKSSSPIPQINKRKIELPQLDYIPLSTLSACSTSSLNNNGIKNKKFKTSTNNLKKNKKFRIQYNNFVKSLSHNSNFADIDNVYTNLPVTVPSSGLRPIVIDGSNVAFVHNNVHHFSCKRLEICIKYFKEKGHKVTAFVPQFRLQSKKNDNPNLLRKLERDGDVILTPSKTIDGRSVVPYDDRFIVQTAVLKGGIIVSRDNYNDLLQENPAWAETIKYRVLAFTWVDDVLMFPKDPLGLHGPSLEEFLRF